jgi:hypothetical protein
MHSATTRTGSLSLSRPKRQSAESQCGPELARAGATADDAYTLAVVAKFTREQVIAELIEADVAREDAQTALDILVDLGLSVARSRELLLHGERSHPVSLPVEGFILEYRPIQALRLDPARALEEVRAYAAANEEARHVADQLHLTMAQVDLLSGRRASRLSAIAEACRLMQNMVQKRGRVGYIARCQHEHYDGRPILDVLFAGQETQLIADLLSGELDLRNTDQLGMYVGGSTAVSVSSTST